MKLGLIKFLKICICFKLLKILFNYENGFLVIFFKRHLASLIFNSKVKKITRG